MHSLWRYIETLPLWKQIGLIAAFFLSLGFSLRDMVSFLLRMYRDWRERCKDDEIADYLIGERQSNANPEVNGYGQPIYPYYRSTLQIATALDKSSIEIHRRLCALEQCKRVDRLAPTADMWTATNFEMHDAKKRWQRRFRLGKRRHPFTASTI